MKRLFSAFVLLGIFFFGLSEWGKSIEKSFVAKEAKPSRAVLSRPSFGSAGLIVPQRRISSISSSTPLEIAMRYLEENSDRLRIQPHHELRPVEFKTPLSTFVRFSVFEDASPILDMAIELEISKSKQIVAVENSYRSLAKVDKNEPLLPLTQIMGKYRETHEIDDKNLSDAAVLFAPQGALAPQWVYVVSGREKTGFRPVQLLIRATDGTLVAKHHSRTEFK